MSDTNVTADPAGERVEVLRSREREGEFALVATTADFDQAWAVCEGAGDVLTWKRHGRWTSDWTFNVEVLAPGNRHWFYELRKHSA